MILFPQIIISTVAFEQEKQSLSDRVRDLYALVRTRSFSSWENLKSIVGDVQKQYFPPNLDFRPRVEEEVDEEGTKQRMKDAAKKTFGSSKSTVEKSAKSAAGAVGNAVHKTKEKVKRQQCSGDDCSHDEL
ncbi:hypothetical protein POM88_003376 [Heracleum sosnowskyi]|uniref:Uncharacterized protein n=1 Tax=Heracleum sosnowskyi TaxID=360622 RepID=A0AAD8ND04_9APIA|nr:hypothetical protein POM88_003376 [Heracleum sosnowskyi]